MSMGLTDLGREARMATAIERAREALKPSEVVKADVLEEEYVRQGDIFAIARPMYSNRELRAMGATITKRTAKSYPNGTQFAPTFEDTRLLGTSHTASERALMPDGTVYARGTLRHEPEGFRDKEHRDQRMGNGKTWHEIRENTVPRSFSDVRAWSGFGRVD